MIFIHIFQWINKLSTLKRSWKLAYSPLKHSCFYAETLLRSIYTFIYLYKRTCSYQLQIVNNFILKYFSFCKHNKNHIYSELYFLNFARSRFNLLGWFLLGLTGFLLSGCCQKTIYISNQPIKEIGISQRPATLTQPAQFYLCGNSYYPCQTVTNLKHINSRHLVSSLNKRKKTYETSIEKSRCLDK